MLHGAQTFVVAIDVAKTKMVAGFGPEERLDPLPGQVDQSIRQPRIRRAGRANCPSRGCASGSHHGAHGDVRRHVRAMLLAHGVELYVMSPKRVHDAAEVFDAVPSMHDAKACVVIAQLHQEKVSKRYVAPTRSAHTCELSRTNVSFTLSLCSFTSANSKHCLRATGPKRSSGNFVGRPTLTKRGNSAVRRYLYLAALRLIQKDPLIAHGIRHARMQRMPIGRTPCVIC